METHLPPTAARLLPLCLLMFLVACSSPRVGGFACINDNDCPPGCDCENDFVAVGVCEQADSTECGGSCDRETVCTGGRACRQDRVQDDLAIYECKGGDLGEACDGDAACDPEASGLGAFCCLDAAKCGQDMGKCVEDCSTYSSEGLVGTFEGADCQDNSECGQGLFCCLTPNPAGNCDFEADQSCTCRGPFL